MKGSISRQVPHGPCRNSPSQSEYILIICAHYIFTTVGCYVELHAVDSPTREVRTAGCGSTGIYQLADHSTIMWYVCNQFGNSFRSRSCTNIRMLGLVSKWRATLVCMYSFVIVTSTMICLSRGSRTIVILDLSANSSLFVSCICAW